MGRPISMDLREQVGPRRPDLTLLRPPVVDWVRHPDEQGSPFVGKTCGHRKLSLAVELPWIRARLMGEARYFAPGTAGRTER